MGAAPSQPELVAAQIYEIRERAAAESGRVTAETGRAAAQARHADALARGAEAVARGADLDNKIRLVAPLVFCGALAFFAMDYYLHESPAYIMRRMLRSLRAPPQSQPLAAVPAGRLLRVPQPLPRLGFLPTMLLGPTGCGKSMLLARLAREAASGPSPAPVVLVRLRLPSSAEGEAGASAGDGEPLIDSAAASVYAQIGFPLRRSLLGAVFSRGFTFFGKHTQADLSLAATRSRLVWALQCLFSACEQLQAERIAAGVPPLDAAPVLLFDEVQDLIKDARLRAAGGDVVFAMLGTLLVAYGVDRRAVRAVVAGSSAELDFAFAACSPAQGARWSYYDLRDPEPEDTVAALGARGYSEAEAARMVSLCGARLRLLEGPLSGGPGTVSASEFLQAAARFGAESFAKVFQQLGAHEAGALARALDTALAAAGAEAGGVALPRKADLPAALRRMDLAPILYVNRMGELSFQSELHRNAWAEVRSRYVAD
jgi:hypothetical protein